MLSKMAKYPENEKNDGAAQEQTGPDEIFPFAPGTMFMAKTTDDLKLILEMLGMDEETKNFILKDREDELEKENREELLRSAPNNNRNAEYLTTSEPETDDDTDLELESKPVEPAVEAAKHRTDVEPEILGSAKMDDVATSASMTSLVWKFAILIFIPTFLAILLYFVPFDFSKSTNRFSKIRGAI
ncbi:LEM domain-containing protein [Caenorhabditis elegans]|uniref:LEM domain-containing protein n=1 Tax=Caenorhabditis elegans TaxID=6239 RepID=C8JQS6_CAEEL|nr:LEM domain-containing protein [Caenorhabditis elegans]CBB16271.1 LEM domain-containing protein [Caenorhabditis elegans]|eukprot:NP_001256885.1 Uncharacterized protein CELE_W04E12.5 [Caenorhabditis elegans]